MHVDRVSLRKQSHAVSSSIDHIKLRLQMRICFAPPCSACQACHLRPNVQDQKCCLLPAGPLTQCDRQKDIVPGAETPWSIAAHCEAAAVKAWETGSVSSLDNEPALEPVPEEPEVNSDGRYWRSETNQLAWLTENVPQGARLPLPDPDTFQPHFSGLPQVCRHAPKAVMTASKRTATSHFAGSNRHLWHCHVLQLARNSLRTCILVHPAKNTAIWRVLMCDAPDQLYTYSNCCDFQCS